MELFARLFEDLLLFVYHCFDRVVIHGYLSGLSRPEQAVYFFRDVGGELILSKGVLSRRTQQYQAWVEAYARNHSITIEWAGKGVRKEDYHQTRILQSQFRTIYAVPNRAELLIPKRPVRLFNINHRSNQLFGANSGIWSLGEGRQNGDPVSGKLAGQREQSPRS